MAVAGERNVNAVLTVADVRKMRRLYDSGKRHSGELARMFGISQSTACKIIKRDAWRHVS